MATLKVGSLGDYIREQRESAQVSLRQLAKTAGVSNPYLSQIERGVKKPSAEILSQIAKGLRISAETLYVRAGILDEHQGSDVVAAILADPTIGERHKRSADRRLRVVPRRARRRPRATGQRRSQQAKKAAATKTTATKTTTKKTDRQEATAKKRSTR